MTDWREIGDGALEVDKPIRSIDAFALRDNPIAIAQRATGAPRMQPPSFEVLPTGVGNWTVPAGVTRVRATMAGGGGGGGGVSFGNDGGGGGSGSRLTFNLDVTPGDVIPYVVGIAGSGGSVTNNGQAGGDTTFGPTGGSNPVAGGGGGGKAGGFGATGAAGAPGAPSGGFLMESGSAFGPRGPFLNIGGPGVGATSSAGSSGQPGTIVLEY